MTGDEHDRGALAGLALNALDADDQASIEEHVAICDQCRQELIELRESVQVLRTLPAEAFLDGPPEGGDLVLQRALRQVRAESDKARVRRRVSLGVAAVLMLVAGALGGALAVRDQEPRQVTFSPPDTETTVAPLPEGTRIGSFTDPDTRAAMTVRVIPASGWIRVNAAVSGIPEGEACRLWVVAADGTRHLAGSWLVSADGAAEGTTLDGSALVAPDEVSAVEVENTDGDHFVSVTF
jgi:hypothetical protein